MPGIDGVNEFTIAELEQLFDSEFEQVPPPVEEKQMLKVPMTIRKNRTFLLTTLTRQRLLLNV